MISLHSAVGWRWRSGENSKQHSIDNYSTNSLMGRANYTFCIHFFLKFSFDSTLTWHSKYASDIGLEWNWMHVTWELKYVDCSAFVCSLQRVEGTGVQRRLGKAVVHSCQNHGDKQWQPAQLQVPLFFHFIYFYQILDLFRARFFLWSQLVLLLYWHLASLHRTTISRTFIVCMY